MNYFEVVIDYFQVMKHNTGELLLPNVKNEEKQKRN